MVNKKGWVRILEAFFSLLLIVLFLFVFVDRDYVSENISARVYSHQISILRDIQLNNSLRQEVLGVSKSDLPLGSSDSSFPQRVKDKVEERLFGNLDCETKICSVDGECDFSQEGKDIYVQQVIITATLQSTDYNPRKLKLFCWER